MCLIYNIMNIKKLLLMAFTGAIALTSCGDNAAHNQLTEAEKAEIGRASCRERV